MSTDPTQTILLAVLVLGTGTATWAAEKSTPSQPAQEGITLNDIAKGLKSAAKSVEQEIPKISPAIGESINQITGKRSPRKPSPPEESSKK